MIYFFIPTYNESENIRTLCDNLIKLKLKESTFYLFVDDASSDNTVELLNISLSGKQFHIIKKDINKGPGDSFNMGFNWILENNSENNSVIITMESDNTSDLNILNDMLTISRLGYDLVLASIYSQSGGFSQTSILRKIISSSANFLLKSFFDIKVLTLSSFYRVYKVDLIKDIRLAYREIIEQSGFISMIEILLKAVKLNARIIEVPMMLQSDKRIGKSKMKIAKNSLDYMKFFIKSGYYLKRIGQSKP